MTGILFVDQKKKMAKNYSSDEEEKDYTSLLLATSAVLRREKNRLEKSLKEIEKSIQEIEFQEVNKMAEKEHQLRGLNESSQQPFLGFAKSSQSVHSKFQPKLTAFEGNGAQSENGSKSKQLTTSKQKVSTEDFSKNYPVDDVDIPQLRLGFGRGRLSSTLPLQVNALSNPFANFSEKWEQKRSELKHPRFNAAIYRDSGTDDVRIKEDDLVSKRCDDVMKKTIGNSLRNEFTQNPNRDERVLPGDQRHRRSSTEVELLAPFFDRCQDQRDSESSTKVELLAPIYDRLDGNHRKRSVRFDDMENQQTEKNSVFNKNIENEGVNADEVNAQNTIW